MVHIRLTAIAVAAACVFGCGVQIRGISDDGISTETPPSTDATEGKRSPSKQPAQLPTAPSDTPAQPPPSDDEPETPLPPNEPATMLSPFHPSNTLTYQRPIDWTIGALDPATSIHYTTNGSTPTSASPAALGMVQLKALPNNTLIRWIAGESNVVHEFTVGVQDDLDKTTHAIVENVRFDKSGGPFVKVAPAAIVTGRAAAVVWNGPRKEQCPNCIDQITVGITQAAACIVSTNPQIYPGAGGNDLTFRIAAPKPPGVYKLRTGFTQQFACNPGAIGTTLGLTEIGTIVVE